MLQKHIILGVHLTDRLKHASEVQAVFTDFGRAIRTRLGLHDVGEEFSSPTGLVLVEFIGSEAECESMKARLGVIEGVEVKSMVFDHP